MLATFGAFFQPGSGPFSRWRWDFWAFSMAGAEESNSFQILAWLQQNCNIFDLKLIELAPRGL